MLLTTTPVVPTTPKFEKMRKHMETEEKTAASIMPKVNKEELAAVTKQYYFHSSVLREEMLPFIWETLTSVERYNYLHLVNFYMLPEEQDKEWLRLVKQVKGFVTEAEFEDLKFRIPSIVTTTNIE